MKTLDRDNKVKAIAMGLAAHHYDRITAQGIDLGFEDSGLYAAQNWDAFRVNAEYAFEALTVAEGMAKATGSEAA